ncbi:GuaB1 family IMP dehydrogenase-related protein [Candidatus Uhrbacteria bacterium]|nr:GuaB1 family IMP dehydrogenase-related protein [Candidatus Uhrbacteria bacterium]
MRFLRPEDEQKELTYNDVFLMPLYSEIQSRMDVDLTPVGNLGTKIPIVVSNMTAVAGKRMAETVTRRGGLVVLPQDIPFERIEDIVRYVKQCHHVYETPVVLKEDQSVQTALNLIHKRSHEAVVITDDNNRPVGIFTEKDSYRRDRYSRLGDVMTRQLISVSSTMLPKEIFHFLTERRLSIVPVIHPDGTLAGVMTRKGAVRATMYQPALNTKSELMTCVAVRVRDRVADTVDRLIQIGVDVIVLDTAHGHQKQMLDAIRTTRAILGSDKPLAAGNIVTAVAADDFIEAGANILKVGVGPGAACKTRMTTGVGRPQFSAVHRVSAIARNRGAQVWADGGVRSPRDVVLALAAGASHAMFGSWFVGTFESPADVQRDSDGNLFKEQFGMASSRAVLDRSRQLDPFEIARRTFFEEGVSQSKMYLKSGQESAEDILDEITAGLRSACTYSGVSNLEMFFQNVVVGVQTSSGFEEGKPMEQTL